MGGDDEFAEFDITEDEFDAMAAASEAVEVVNVPARRSGDRHDLYVLVSGSPETYSALVASTSGLVPVIVPGASAAVFQGEYAA